MDKYGCVTDYVVVSAREKNPARQGRAACVCVYVCECGREAMAVSCSCWRKPPLEGDPGSRPGWQQWPRQEGQEM